ncbi:MAG: MBOAT family protein [Deltaproteobacteria bacterium]|nr:MBOAT family protein [Deltaproteobacteria bacterium]
MEFPTIKFVYFGLATLTISWLVRQNRTVQNTFLLLASYAFAWKLRPMFLVILIGSSVFNYFIGRRLAVMKGSPFRKPLLVVGLLGNLGTLGFYKYYDFFVENLGDLALLLDLSVHLPLLELIAPLGISFYTFQAVAYLVDTYREKAIQPRTLLDFCLFMAFFPKFAAGPICRTHQLLPQIMAPAPNEIPHLSRAVALITTGLVKKMLFASYVASKLTTDAFLAPASYSSLELVLAVFAYTAQVYLDFSGYTDIARGVGLLFGFDLPENFNHPYRSTDIGEFWRRWHITFSTWLREYIYFPLGGSRHGALRTVLNLLVTFTACGIWHGASWGFIVWGALHGVALAGYKLSLDVRRKMGIDTDAPRPIWVLISGWFLTINFCAFVRIFFKTTDLETSLEFFRTLGALTYRGSGFDLGVLFVTSLTIALNFVGRRVFDAFVSWHEGLGARARPLVWAGLMLGLFALKPYGMEATIYFAF